MVFIHHAFPDAFRPGALGVDVFFVISGFLITRILLKERSGGGIKLGRFYINRALRLYPPLIVAVVIFAPFFALVGGISLVNVVGGSVIALTYTGNIVMTLTDRTISYLSHTWSLAMEEQFYLVWPALIILATRLGLSRRKMTAIACVLAAASFGGWFITATSDPYNPLTKAGGLLLGAAMAFALHRKTWESETLAWVGVVAFVAVLAGEQTGILERGASVPLATLATLPVIAHLFFGSGAMVRGLSHPALVYLGVISYEIYLFHYPLFFYLHGKTDLSEWVAAAIALVLTFALSVASRRWISAPVLAWRDSRRESQEPRHATR